MLAFQIVAVTLHYNERGNGVSNSRVENAESKTIQVMVNGQPRHVPDGGNIAALLQYLEIDPSRVAVELNREIVRKLAWETTLVSDGAQIEIVWFVGGG
jgi:sulfur carrier protein